MQYGDKNQGIMSLKLYFQNLPEPNECMQSNQAENSLWQGMKVRILLLPQPWFQHILLLLNSLKKYEYIHLHFTSFFNAEKAQPDR